MGRKKQKDSEEIEEQEKQKKILVSIYPEEIEKVQEKIEESGQELIYEEGLNSRDIRVFFDLKPTHRGTGIKKQVIKGLNNLPEDEQKEILEEIKRRSGDDEQ